MIRAIEWVGDVKMALIERTAALDEEPKHYLLTRGSGMPNVVHLRYLGSNPAQADRRFGMARDSLQALAAAHGWSE